MSFIRRFIRKVSQFNVFADGESIREGNIEVLRDQVISTRIYLVLLLSSLISLILFTSLIEITKSVTIPTPSESEYIILQSDYPNTLICPCKQITIPYDRFSSINPIYHQICRSNLTSYQWIESLFNRDIAHMTPLDIRLTISAQFRLLSIICASAMTGVGKAADKANKGKLVSAEVLSNHSFTVQMDIFFNKLLATLEVVIKASRGFKLIMHILVQSRIYSALHTDVFITSKPDSNQYSVINNYYPLHDNASFTNNMEDDFGYCDPFHRYTYKAGIYSWATESRSLQSMMTPSPSPVYVIPGMHVGCMPYDALVESNLHCFFDPICFNSTMKWISTLNESNWPKLLDNSIPSKFYTNDTIDTIFSQQMLEQWNFEKNFSRYYSLCDPIQCTYTFDGYNDFIYIITMIISLFGGLSTVLRVLSPLIVQFIRKTQLYFKNKREQIPLPQQPKQDWRMKINDALSSVKMKIISLNLFKDDIESELVGIRATRVHIILISFGLITLTLYSSIIISTRLIIVSKPSIDQFEGLYEKHRLTLECPCSQVAIPNNQIVKVSSPQYHQVCQSQFVQSSWLDGYFKMNFINESTKQTPLDVDFRSAGLYLFHNVLLLCNWANDTFSNSKDVFNQDTFASSQTLSRTEFNVRVELLIKTFKQSTVNDIVSLLNILRFVIAASGTQSGIEYQSLYINSSRLIRRYSPPPLTLNDCACSVSYDCPKIVGQFYCVNGNNCTVGAVWSVPGLMRSCIEIDTLLNSDLRCFYNQTCFNKILSLYNLDMPTRMPLPNDIFSIPILNVSSPSNFQPDNTLGTIFNSLMIEQWQVTSSFEDYYESCLPLTCKYTYNQRLDVSYVIATITGLLGGLMLTFRLLIRTVAVCILWLNDYYHNENIPSAWHDQNEQQSRFKLFWLKIKNNLKTMNFFKKESSVTTDIRNVNDMAVIATHFYIILFTCSIVILLLFNGLRQAKTSITIKNPSLNQFEQLYQQYSASLLCPCEQITISYKTFLSVSARMHQVCNSKFITPLWTTTLYGYGPHTKGYNQLDRPILSKQHQILSWFCFTSQRFITNTISGYEESILVSATAMSRDSFQSEVRGILSQLVEQTPILFWSIISFTTDLSQGSQFATAFNTDWLIEIGNASNDYLLRNIPIEFPNSTCTCSTSGSCTRPMRIGPSDLLLPGLVVSCWPLNGLFMSTLECFYSSTCINSILNHLNYFTEIDGSPPTNFTLPEQLPLQINPLNNLTSSRFSPNTTIDKIKEQLFMEEYTSKSSYENYYKACSPAACEYEYINRNSFLYIITSILSLYGGLTISLRFFSWNFLRTYTKIRYYFITKWRGTPVQPITIQRQ